MKQKEKLFYKMKKRAQNINTQIASGPEDNKVQRDLIGKTKKKDLIKN